LGDRDNVQALSVDGALAYKAENYFGDNMVVVGTGAINHEQFVEQVAQQFCTVAKAAQEPQINSENNVYIPGLMFVRDDEMVNSNIIVYYDAPTFKDEDYYGFMLLKNMFGSYRIDQNAGHLNDTRK
jgi:processing peptidase subunit beta